MSIITLYGKPDCHLCDIAHDMITSLTITPHELNYIDIQSDPELMQRYGEHIPVLLLPDGRTLFWPFHSEQVQSLLTH